MTNVSPKTSVASQVRRNIAELSGYAPGEQPQGGKWIKLNTNENPYPPSPAVHRALIATASGSSLAKYPDPLATAFRMRAADAFRVSPEMIISGDVFSPVEPQGIGTLSRHLADATKMAADYDIQLALEFDSRASFPNNLQSAIALIDDIGLPSLGLCLDWFHWTIGPSKLQDLALLSDDNLSHVQLSDIADVPREMARDSDRILPGEGCSPPEPLIDWLTQIGYSAAVSVELHNPSLWHVPPRQFGEIAITALRKILGQAEM